MESDKLLPHKEKFSRKNRDYLRLSSGETYCVCVCMCVCV